MSLAARIKSAQPNSRNEGCQSCTWWPTISSDSQKLINDWLDGGFSQAQLHDIISAPDESGDDPPLLVGLSGWRLHLKHHQQRCR